MAEIKGKIVRILSDTEVVIDRGLSDGVRYSMEFAIYEEGDPVIDPESREILEPIELVKDRVYVTHIQKRICIAQTAAPGLDIDSAIARGKRKTTTILNRERGAKSFQPKLEVDPGAIHPPRNVSHIIRVCDKVRSIER